MHGPGRANARSLDSHRQALEPQLTDSAAIARSALPRQAAPSGIAQAAGGWHVNDIAHIEIEERRHGFSVAARALSRPNRNEYILPVRACERACRAPAEAPADALGPDHVVDQLDQHAIAGEQGIALAIARKRAAAEPAH